MNAITEKFLETITAAGGELPYDELEPLTLTPELFRFRGRISSVWQEAETTGLFHRVLKKDPDTGKTRLYIASGPPPPKNTASSSSSEV